VSVCLSVCPAMRFRISQRILSKLGGNIPWVLTRLVGYIYVFVRAHVNSVIVGWIISKLAGNILRIATSCMGYVLFTFEYLEHERD
jgi:hypothetical protein